MKNSVFKLFFIFLMATFSIIWISDKLSVFLEKEKYSYYETTEKSDSENQLEIKLKTLFVNQIDLLNLVQFSSSTAQKNNSFYSFNVKEFCFESHTPPPEIA